MTSERKLEANRANALKRTGPTTRRGQLHARLNALKNGVHAATTLLPGEDAAAYKALAQEVFGSCAPAGPLEAAVTERVLDCIWRLTRLKKAEYAALKRVETEVLLSEQRRAKGEARIYRDVDLVLREVLATEERTMSQRTAVEVGVAKGIASNRKFAAVVAREDPLPTGYVFLSSYGPLDSGRLTAEIDRQTQVSTRELLRLQDALSDMQERRQTHTVTAIEAQ